MNKTWWDEMVPRQRDEVIALNLMGWQPSVLQNIYAQLRPPGADECTVDMAPHYTTDRNACALVLDEIAKKKLWQTFSMNMQKHLGIPDNGPDIWVAIWCANRADPDTICYCAIKAVES